MVFGSVPFSRLSCERKKYSEAFLLSVVKGNHIYKKKLVYWVFMETLHLIDYRGSGLGLILALLLNIKNKMYFSMY